MTTSVIRNRWQFWGVLVVVLFAMVGCLEEGSSGGGSDGQTVAESQTAVLAAEAVTLTMSDGAALVVPAGFHGGAGAQASWERLVSNDDIPSGTVSSWYRLTIEHTEAVAGRLIISLPLSANRLTAGWRATDLQVLGSDGHGGWVRVRSIRYIDSTNMVLLVELDETDLFTAEKVAGGAPSSVFDTLAAMLVTPAMADAGVTTKISSRDIIVYERSAEGGAYVIGEEKTVVVAGSKFKITYTTRNTQVPGDVVPGDTEWNAKKGHSTGANMDAGVPDYIEDLDLALTQAYAKLLTLVDADGNLLFQPLPLPIEITVCDVGDASGDSPLGGPARISSRLEKIENWPDLRVVAAHELVHVLQGQYYTNGKAGARLAWLTDNVWFIEGVADHYGPWAASLSDQEKYAYFSKQGAKDYLSGGLTRSVDTSMYASSHFLGWLEAKYPGLVASAIRAGGDLAALTAKLDAKGGLMNQKGGLKAAWLAYGHELIRTPENGEKLNLFVLNQMNDRASGFLSVVPPNPRITDTVTYMALSRTMPSLSMTYLQVNLRNTEPGLLVIDTSNSTNKQMKSVTYDFESVTNSPYLKALPLDFSPLREITSEIPMRVVGAGKGTAHTAVQQLFINPDSADAGLDIRYWMLLPPTMSGVADGATSWLTAELGNIPRENIKGYNVYRRSSNPIKSKPEDMIQKLNSEIVPLPESGPSVIYSHADLHAGDTTVAQVVDKYNSKWPVVKQESCELSVTRKGIVTELFDTPTDFHASFFWGDVYNPESTRTFTFTMQTNSNGDRISDFAAVDYLWQPAAGYGLCPECTWYRKWSIVGKDLPRRPDLESVAYPRVYYVEGAAVCGHIQSQEHITRDGGYQRLNTVTNWTCDQYSVLKLVCGSTAF